MKKCASCTKDLPDAALHCVFCGSKQPPPPAGQHGVAKTAFGYSAAEVGEVIDQLRQQSGPAGRPAPTPTLVSPPPPPAAPRARSASVPAVGSQPQPALPRPAAPPDRPVPASAASAATMFVPGAQPPAALAATMVPPPSSPIYGRPKPPTPAGLQAPTMIAPQAVAIPMPAPAAQPQMPAPMKMPAAQPPPYLAAQTASRAGRPVEPWIDSLRLVMLVWGAGLLVVFATPLRLSPDLVFHWNAILHGEGPERLPPLMLAAVGVLSMIVAGIPMPPAARGSLAALLGLAGIIVPITLVGTPSWQSLAVMAGTLVLVPALLVRSEYRDAALPRVLAMFGALGVLAPAVIPQNGAIPLVGVFRSLVDQPGADKVPPALALGLVVIVVMSMLAWLPGPVTGGAKLWAWLLILWGAITQVALLILAGHLIDAVRHAPNQTVVAWIAGGSSPNGSELGLGAAYIVLVGYGLASVLGKQLE